MFYFDDIGSKGFVVDKERIFGLFPVEVKSCVAVLMDFHCKIKKWFLKIFNIYQKKFYNSFRQQ